MKDMKDLLQPTTERQIAQQKYDTARGNLILMIGASLLNIILFVAGEDIMLLFSATVPYVTAMAGVLSENSVVLTVCLAVTAVILLLYFLCWIFSKKQYGWLIAAMVLFGLDTLFLIGLYIFAQDASGILDFIFHIWVFYYLVVGVRQGIRLKQMPAEAPVPAEEASKEGKEAPPYTYTSTNGVAGDSQPLRKADTDVKFRVLLEADAFGHHICYRRVKRVNELVIDGYVYDEMKKLLETAHELRAIIDGHKIQVGYDEGVYSYLYVDGELITKKMRLY